MSSSTEKPQNAQDEKPHRACFCTSQIPFVKSLVDTFSFCSKDGPVVRPGTAKTEEQRKLIKKVVETASCFQHIAKDKIELVVDAFCGPVEVSAGTVVIRQGDSARRGEPCLYLIESGSFDVFVVKSAADKEMAPSGKLSYTFDQPGQIFGHLGLLFDVPRTASVIASRDGIVWHLDRDSFQNAIDCNETAEIVARHSLRVTKAGLHPQSISTSFAFFDVNLTNPARRKDNLPKYWTLCKDPGMPLMCTLSCFGAWNVDKKTNGSAKIIPALHSSSKENVRIFFFDDNIEWAGTATSPGIVNLRNVENSEFVEFGKGVNGFEEEHFGTNTVIHHSSEYRNVLVQANILDAMEDEEYFNKIISKYAQAGEKLVIIMDINSTIISVDSVSRRDMSQLVLGTMFEFITLTPLQPFNYQWEDSTASWPNVEVKKAMSLKKLVKGICKDKKEFYDRFYTYDNCVKILTSVPDDSTLTWSQQDKPVSLDSFKELFDRYAVSLVGGTTQEGITQSWFKTYEKQSAAGHSLILNTFGMDSRKVIIKTVDDEREVLQMCVSFDKWDARDKALFNKMYGDWR